jgi:hypothetical protein
MTHDKKILMDLERWSDEKLRQWFLDSIERYKMIDVSDRTAFSYAMTTLVMFYARLIVETSTATPEESADQVKDVIKFMKKAKRKQQED